MNTLIWDNGQAYSSHEIWFIQPEPGENLDDVLQVLSLYEESQVEAIAEIHWRVPGRTSTMTEWLEGHVIKLVDFMNNGDGYPAKREALHCLPAMWRTKIADALKKSVAGGGFHESWNSDVDAIVADLNPSTAT